MRRARGLALALALAPSCTEETVTYEPPPGDEPPCVEAPGRTRTVRVAGTVVDLATGEPVAGATVRVATAYDAPFPAACGPLPTLTTDGDGHFGPARVELTLGLYPPMALLLVTGEGLAPTAADRRIACPLIDSGDGCALAEAEPRFTVPAAATAQAWRRVLLQDRLPDADTTGLALVRFREPGGSPAAGVIPWVHSIAGQATPLIPRTEVRFLAADGVTVTEASSDRTEASGLALVHPFFGGLVAPHTAMISGRRGSDAWNPTGALLPDGWIFVKDVTP